MKKLSANPLSCDYERVFRDHAEKLCLENSYRITLAKKVCGYFKATDTKNIRALYTTFLWIYVFDWGKTRTKTQDEDQLRNSRMEDHRDIFHH